jgi:hypothetical protein
MITVTLSLDTSAYASGDLLADTQEVTNYLSVAGTTSYLQSMTVVDEDDQKVAFDVYFLSSNVTMGSENSAPSISDANSRSILGFVSVIATDYKDLGGTAIASIKNIGLTLTGQTGLWVAVVNGSGTPTYSAAGVKLRLGFVRAI